MNASLNFMLITDHHSYNGKNSKFTHLNKIPSVDSGFFCYKCEQH